MLIRTQTRMRANADPTPDESEGLRAIIGAYPDLYWHGDDLGAAASTVTTLTNRIGASGVADGNPTVSASDWVGSRKTVLSDGTGDRLTWNSFAAAHQDQPNLPFTWLFGVKLPAAAATRNLGGWGDTGSVAYKVFQIQTTDRLDWIQSTPPASGVNGAANITEGAPMLIGASFDGLKLYVERLTSSGSTVVHNSVSYAPGSGSIVMNTFSLLGWKSSSASSIPGSARICVLKNGHAALPERVSAALVHIRDNLNCPLA